MGTPEDGNEQCSMEGETCRGGETVKGKGIGDVHTMLEVLL